MTFFGEIEHFSGRIGALRWSILVGKQKHNVQKPTRKTVNTPEKISGMFIVSRPIRCEMKPQKITAKPQHGLVTT